MNIHVCGPQLLCKLAQNRLLWYHLVEHVIPFNIIPYTWCTHGVFAHSLHILSTHSNSSNHNHIPMIPFKYRHISTKNLNRLTVSLNNEEWTSVFNTNNVDESFENFMNIFTKHFDKCIPLCSNKKPKYKKNPRLPWISNSLLRSINRKNNLYYKYKANPSARNRNKYTRYKNILTKLILYEKKILLF